MKRLEDWFIIHHARSAILAKYESGPVPYLANGLGDNAVAAYVTPMPGDKVFKFRAVVVSAFGETTVQMPPFIAYGAAGTSLTVLEPRSHLSNGELAYLAAWLRAAMKGRFNWYFRSISDRIKRMPMPSTIPTDLTFDVKTLLPETVVSSIPKHVPLATFQVDDLFKVHRAKSGLFSDYELGSVAYVGNGQGDNGFVGKVTPLPTDRVFNFTAIVISAFCEATVQPPPFIACGRAGNGLVILEPKDAMPLEQLFCAAAYFNQALKWRFNWYHQTTADRVKRLRVALPAHNGQLDKDSAMMLARAVPYWDYLSKYLQTA